LDKIKNLILIGSPVLIGMGAIKLILFYKSFNFNVIEFIELTEVLILFLNDIFYLIIMIIMGVIFEFVQTSKYELNKIQNIQNEIKQSEKFGKRIKNYYKLYKEGLWAILVFGITDLAIYITSKTTNENIHLLFIFTGALCLTMIVWAEIKLKIKRLSGDNVSTRMNNFIVIFIIISAFFSNNIFNEIRSVKKDKIYYGTEIHYQKFDDKIKFISDSTSYYIGKTKNYVFIFQELNNTTKIIPVKNINQIIIKKK